LNVFNSLNHSIMNTNEDDLLEYNDDEALKFILKSLPAEVKDRIDEETVQYVLDVIYDFYNEKGYIDEEDTAEETSIDEEEMYEYILENALKDEINLTEDDIQLILDAEFDYGKSLGIYKEE